MKFLRKAGEIWLRSSMREWLRKLFGVAGSGSKLSTVDRFKKKPRGEAVI